MCAGGREEHRLFFFLQRDRARPRHRSAGGRANLGREPERPRLSLSRIADDRIPESRRRLQMSDYVHAATGKTVTPVGIMERWSSGAMILQHSITPLLRSSSPEEHAQSAYPANNSRRRPWSANLYAPRRRQTINPANVRRGGRQD